MGGLIKFYGWLDKINRGNTFNAAAPGESRELYLNIARLTLFGCSRHPDAKPVNKLQTINLEPVTT